jgi:hypothetical protein
MSKTQPMFPSTILNVDGPQGNAYAVMGTVENCMKRAGYDRARIDEVITEMKAGDYDHLISVARQWITIVGHSPAS